MQVTYKTISSYEYDVQSGIFKKVDKEVEDASGSKQSFMDMVLANQENENDVFKESFVSSNQNSFNTDSAYASKANLYAYKFKQDQGIQSEEVGTQTSSKHSSMLNDILNAL
ncbi:hypothetical protein [Campylobacter sp. US33a]|uniref:hypothetical protein n=1 Tax=Campylobacter sp. US33a TaxID=2498120 RepID=UPI0010680272|nr:hypothetical protein [Campylobacter sp. US33a]TEY00499.1 hypothetical protein ELQ16_09120 [Campylobacter sp. US33a]